MATAAGIIVLTGALTLASDALAAPYKQGSTNVVKYVNWRVVPATALAAMLFAGLETLNPTLGKGLAGVVLLTALVHPFGSSPSIVTELSSLVGKGNSSSAVLAQGNAPLPTAQAPIAV